MLAEMKALVKQKNICVLATITDTKPYCSLMAYATDEGCTRIYMATRHTSQKFRNLLANPCVSLLIDSREAIPRSAAQALTVAGVCEVVSDPYAKQKLAAALIAAHPHLDEFINHPQNEILCIRITSFLLLKGLTESFFALAK